MKEGWKRVKLGNAISAIGDHRGRTPPKLTFGKYRVLSAKNIKTGKIVAEDSIGYFDDDLYAKYVRMEIERGDIIITSEAPFGQVYYWNSDEKVALSQRLFSIRLNDGFEPRFVYYYLTTDKFQAELASRASGTTVMGLRQTELLKCEVICPPLPVQRRIAAVLGALDDKIELNRKMNANLEAQAQALFKSWFVDFTPWGGKMPKEWKKIPLSEIADFHPGYSYKGNELRPSRVAMATIKNYERRGGFKLDGFKEIVPSSKLKESQTVEVFDTLVAHTDMTQNADVIGNAEIVLSNGGYDKLIMSMDLVKVVPKRGISRFLIAALLKNPVFKAHCLGYVNGTTVLHMSKSALAEYRLRFPGDAKCLDGVSKSFEATYRMMAMNIEESRKLAETRDALLPKLMSGEVEVA